METISATELARHLSDILNRVKYKGEEFVVERNGEPVARLAPSSSSAKSSTLGDLVEIIRKHPVDDKFADDLEVAHREMNQPLPPPPEWPD